MKSPSPDSLPIILKALESSKGELRSVLVDILGVYKDPRKISALIKAARPYDGDPTDVTIGDQLTELGTPAGQALIDSLPAKCDESDDELSSYTSWVGFVIGHINPWSLSVLFAGLRSGNPCKQRAAQEGLQMCCAEPEYGLGDPQITLFTSAVLSDDERIRSAAEQWIDSFRGEYRNFEFAGTIEVLIAAYQKNASPATMIEIARLLADDPCPRVTRFMRAAVSAPNPEIQQIAHEYLAKNHLPRTRGSAKPTDK
jgi:hypothetical protein